MLLRIKNLVIVIGVIVSIVLLVAVVTGQPDGEYMYENDKIIARSP